MFYKGSMSIERAQVDYCSFVKATYRRKNAWKPFHMWWS